MNVPLYDLPTYLQKKKDASDAPPPLPPPLVLDDDVSKATVDDKVNGLDPEGLVFLPDAGSDAKFRRLVPLPRVHVYETVPDDIAQVNEFVMLMDMMVGEWGKGEERKET